MAADTVAARLGADPATVRIVVRTELPEEIADAIGADLRSGNQRRLGRLRSCLYGQSIEYVFERGLSRNGRSQRH
jgi:hypothetical protein